MSIEAIHKTFITMGEGDVITGMGVGKDRSGILTFMQADEAREPGTRAPELEGKHSVIDSDAAIKFKDVRAVDFMIGELQALREKMVLAGGGE